jgi:hypothetical protein
MKLLVTQGFSRSLPSRSTCGYLPCSRRKCQKFARNDPQGCPENLHSPVLPRDERKSSSDRFQLRDAIGFYRTTRDLCARTNRSEAANDLERGNRSLDRNMSQFRTKNIRAPHSDRRSRIALEGFLPRRERT